jgi:hypothetical protein
MERPPRAMRSSFLRARERVGEEGAEQEEELFCLKFQRVEVAAVEAATRAQAEDFDRRKFIHATAHTLSTVGRDGQGRQESGGSSN